MRWFGSYAERYVRRHFHAVRVSCDDFPPSTLNKPLVIFGNHASWWDPLIGIILARRFFAGHTLFAPMDATALARYRFFAQLGFFGVELDSARGAARFLRTSIALLEQPKAMLWLTPQGRFADPRERPVQFKPGIGYLAARLAKKKNSADEAPLFLPTAAEYQFWQERTPEVLIRFGAPIVARGNLRNADEWTRALEKALEQTQDDLARDAQRRDSAAFQTILSGRAGIGGVYDLWRALCARLRGESFHPEHGT